MGNHDLENEPMLEKSKNDILGEKSSDTGARTKEPVSPKIMLEDKGNPNQNSQKANPFLNVGTVLKSTYRIDGFLASGGFGNTYEATHLSLDKKMVVKEFYISGVTIRDKDNVTVSVSHPDNKPLFEEQKRKFKKEAQRIFDLSNKHIVKVFDLFEENNTVYYSMEFIDGLALNRKMKDEGRPFTESETMDILSQMLDALETIHQQNLWHMDIKPGNILMDKNGNCTLIDFGSSKRTDQSGAHVTTTAMSYTPGYAPPEQVNGSDKKWGPWTDFYALGATLYNLLTTKKPPQFDNILDVGEKAFDFPKNVSDKLKTLVIWMMNPSPSNRPQSVDAIQNFLVTADTNMQQKNQDEATVLGATITQAQNEKTVIGEVPAKGQQNSIFNSKKLIFGLIGSLVLALAVFLYLLGKKNGAEENPVSSVPEPQPQEETVVIEKKDDKVEQNKGEETVEDVVEETVWDVSGDYWGTVAGKSVEMQISHNGNSISGRDRYTSVGYSWMDVFGSINEDGSAYLEENNDGFTSGYYNGRFSGSSFSGTFTNYNGKSFGFSFRKR